MPATDREGREQSHRAQTSGTVLEPSTARAPLSRFPLPLFVCRQPVGACSTLIAKRVRELLPKSRSKVYPLIGPLHLAVNGCSQRCASHCTIPSNTHRAVAPRDPDGVEGPHLHREVDQSLHQRHDHQIEADAIHDATSAGAAQERRRCTEFKGERTAALRPAPERQRAQHAATSLRWKPCACVQQHITILQPIPVEGLRDACRNIMPMAWPESFAPSPPRRPACHDHRDTDPARSPAAHTWR